MRVQTLINKLIRLPGLWVKRVDLRTDALVVHIRRRFRKLTCPHCGTSVRGRFSQRERTWRHLSIWGLPVLLRGTIRRLRCHTCDCVVTEAVPWARHESDFTRPFEDAVALLAQRTDKTTVTQLCHIAWRTVGNIAERVVDELLDGSRLFGLKRIGVDEISYRRHHKYLTVIIDHDTGNVVWAAEGKSSETLGQFFKELDTDTRKQIELVTMDLSAAYKKAVEDAVPGAEIAFDKFHLVQLANKALTEVRRTLWRQLSKPQRRSIKDARWALLKKPGNLSDADHLTLDQIRKAHRPVHRAWLLKEAFCEVLRNLSGDDAIAELRAWLAWASRSRLRPFVRLGRTIRNHLDGIITALDSGFSNARLEGMNNKIRLLSHRAYGFHSAQALIAMIHLCCSNVKVKELQLV